MTYRYSFRFMSVLIYLSFFAWCELSIGSLGSGNSEAYVSGVTINGAKLYGTSNGLRIKTWPVSDSNLYSII